MQTNQNVYPVARKAGLVIREVTGEVLVYDLERDKAHCLNDTAARIWKYCDGERSVGEIAKLLAGDLHAPVEEDTVWQALAKLENIQLLEDLVVPPTLLKKMDRRDSIRRLALVSLVAVPLITSIIAPTPAQSASPPP